MHLSLTKSTFATPNFEIHLKKQLGKGIRKRNQKTGQNTKIKEKNVKDYITKKMPNI
jgi:hypothetical protein